MLAEAARNQVAPSTNSAGSSPANLPVLAGSFDATFWTRGGIGKGSRADRRSGQTIAGSGRMPSAIGIAWKRAPVADEEPGDDMSSATRPMLVGLDVISDQASGPRLDATKGLTCAHRKGNQ